MTGRFYSDAGTVPLSTRRTIAGPISSAKITYGDVPLIVSPALINQDPEAPRYKGAQLNAACADFIYR
jgi:hypothetical protein